MFDIKQKQPQKQKNKQYTRTYVIVSHTVRDFKTMYIYII